MFKPAALAVMVSVLALAAPASAQSGFGWQPYTDPGFGFSAELPLGTFEVVDAGGAPGLALQEIGGQATVNLNGGPAQGMTRDAMEARLETAARVATTTYRAGGDSWFVLSGFYEDGAEDDTIFYTKVLFSPDQQTFSAFEITFPASDKPRFESMVEYFEDNFTRPRT
ncbi:hypothetical protein [Pelagibacterium montanilacus]|uniref:hypothetical protein n=1 Tax=Pelagibacterium montanilacus TaxID=2185280 RepID=UPI000F8F0E35|nr:hypothetical protein [Pelagibacterium montanilacus]